MIRIQQIKVPVTYTEQTLIHEAAKKLKLSDSAIQELKIRKRSIDARKKPEIYYVFTLDVSVKNEAAVIRKCHQPSITVVNEKPYRAPEHGTQPLKDRPVIIGCGPAGLFCGLLLAREGYHPLILERGDSIADRSRTVETFWTEGKLDTESNIQFGEGGAGTFSDGKLNTMVKDPNGRNHFVLRTFVEAGADSSIIYVNKPHIGTDVLRTVITHIRQEIESLDGEVRFRTKMTDLTVHSDESVTITTSGGEQITTTALVLAIGHSARDTFRLLNGKNLLMMPKSFAVGLRMEHPQSLINESQYGMKDPKSLPVADYKVTHQCVNGRGVYSFCMCPGGYVVNASSEEGMLAVNGMSYSKRDGQNANSAMIVTVTPDDFGYEGVLGGMEFQRKLERFAYQAGNGKIPVQLFEDFRNSKPSRQLGDVQPCTKGGYELTNLREGLPSYISESIEEGVLAFERQIKGFSRPDALLLGVESRTSSPVKMVRNEEFTSNLSGIYPCGEGAGYAGGITSAAMDGLKVAEAIIRKYRSF